MRCSRNRESSSPRSKLSKDHTTHYPPLRELPATVRITRKAHVLEGEVVAVLKQLFREGRLRLLLLFPDGSRRIVPVEWTDAATDESVPTGNRELVGEPQDLLRIAIPW